MKTATQVREDSMRADMRKLRSRAFVAEIMQIISRRIDGDEYGRMRDIHLDLEQLCQENGVEILTDHIRQEMRLPPRGTDGWTDDEIFALERRRLEILSRPLTMPVWPDKSSTDAS